MQPTVKKRLLLFHPALAPYRIDQFNDLGKFFNVHVVFVLENIWNYKMDQTKLREKLTINYSYLLQGPQFRGRVFRFGMLKKIKEFEPDIIIGYEYSFTTLYLILLKKLGIIQQALGTTVDDSLEISRHVQSKMRGLARNFALKHLDYIIVLSEEVSSYYQKRFSLDKQNIIVCPILQNPERIRKDQDSLVQIAENYFHTFQLKGKKIILFVGRLVPEKGLTNFIEIITPQLKNDPDLMLIAVGDGPEKEGIERLITRNEIRGSVILPGRYEDVDLLAWYHCASAFVLPSLYEPFGAVINEALIFGLNVFCSQFAGSSYLATGSEDMIFNPKDINQSRLKFEAFASSLQSKHHIANSLAPVRMKIKYNEIYNDWKRKIYGGDRTLTLPEKYQRQEDSITLK